VVVAGSDERCFALPEPLNLALDLEVALSVQHDVDLVERVRRLPVRLGRDEDVDPDLEPPSTRAPPRSRLPYLRGELQWQRRRPARPRPYQAESASQFASESVTSTGRTIQTPTVSTMAMVANLRDRSFGGLPQWPIVVQSDASGSFTERRIRLLASAAP